MKKKLVFYFYANPQNINCEINKTHFACLREYIGIFDECLFVISVDDINNFELIKKVEKKFLDINKNGNITFKVHQNNEFRESSAFKKEVADKLGEDKLVFFGHNKGTTNTDYDKSVIQAWVNGMYFYSLNFINEVLDYLLNKQYFSYGSFLAKEDGYHYFVSKYNWAYIGTFFWINSGKILNFIKSHNIEIPNLADRFYAEDFLSNLYDIWPLSTAASHKNRYLTLANDFYKYAKKYIDVCHPEHQDFDEFNKHIIETIKNEKDLV